MDGFCLIELLSDVAAVPKVMKTLAPLVELLLVESLGAFTWTVYSPFHSE